MLDYIFPEYFYSIWWFFFSKQRLLNVRVPVSEKFMSHILKLRHLYQYNLGGQTIRYLTKFPSLKAMSSVTIVGHVQKTLDTMVQNLFLELFLQYYFVIIIFKFNIFFLLFYPFSDVTSSTDSVIPLRRLLKVEPPSPFPLRIGRSAQEFWQM